MPASTASADPPLPQERPRGAPPGNQNALKHGFYSRRFRNLELGDLEEVAGNLVDEINGLRVAARRVLEYSEELGDDPLKAVQTLNCFGMLCNRIANLLRVQASLTSANDENQTAISIALARVVETLNLKGSE